VGECSQINIVALFSLLLTLPAVDVENLWQYLYEGDFIGLATALLVSVFSSVSMMVIVLYMMFFVPIYIRTKSLMLICVLWIILGGFFIMAMPIASGIAIFFSALGIAGLFWRLFRKSDT